AACAAEHFSSGAAGEGEEENALWRDPFFDKEGNAAGEGPGFSRAGAGDDEDGAVAAGDGLKLLFVEGGLPVRGLGGEHLFVWQYTAGTGVPLSEIEEEDDFVVESLRTFSSGLLALDLGLSDIILHYLLSVTQ